MNYEQEIVTGLKGLGDTLDTRLNSMQSELDCLAQKQTFLPGESKQINPIATAIKSDDVQRFIKGELREARVVLDNVSVKDLVSGGLGDSNSDPVSVPEQRAPMTGEDARQPLNLLQAMPTIQVNSGTFEFLKLANYTNAADYQATEGDTKAEQDLVTELEQVQISTIAAWTDYSRQLEADLPMFVQQMTDKLRHAVRLKLENELIAGAGVDGGITGISSKATAASVSATAAADKIAEAMAECQNAGWNPNTVMLNPTNWVEIVTERANSGADEYVHGGALRATMARPSLWGMNVVVSPSVTAGTAFVADIGEVVLLDRSQVTLEWGYSGTGFKQNVRTALAELRAGLAVMSPSALLSVSV